MASAKYTIHTPALDELGQPLRVHEAVYTHLNDLGAENPSIYEGKPTHGVTAWAEDIPEWDSTMKQIGAHTGEVANVPHVYVTKEGKNVASWPIANPFYRMGEGAEQAALHPLPQPDPLPAHMGAVQLFL